jgi:hypothetical protein
MESKSETGIRLVLSRTKDGVVLSVKTNPTVEAFMRALGDGTMQDVNTWNNKWATLPGDKPLMIWNADVNTITEMSNGTRYRLDSPGSKLEFPPDYGNQSIYNLSFFRIVGASEGDGVRFLIKNTVIGKDGLLDMRDKLISLSKQLYVDFIRPVEASGFIYQTATQEVFF